MSEKYLSGTRPEISDGRVLLSSAEGFDGYEIMNYKGMVWGMSVRAKDMGQDCMTGCKSMTGGELTSMTKLSDESRQRAVDRMIHMAKAQGANGIINVNFDISGAAQGITEVSVQGTAVVLEAIPNYVPAGAVGNVLNDIKDKLK